MFEHIYQDILELIYKEIPYDIKNMANVNHFCYNTYKLFKKNHCNGNYYLSKIQNKMINDMNNHITTLKDNSLIIQAQLSVGKTAAILAFAMDIYKGSVVIMVPLSIIAHWYNEIIKMYGNQAFNKILILHDQYTTPKIKQLCRYHYCDPKIVGYKIVIISSLLKISPDHIMKHSLLIMDEVHLRQTGIYNHKFIGVTASKAIAWVDKAYYKIYEDQEILPNITKINIIIKENQLNQEIITITKNKKGPYLIICNKHVKNNLTVNYIFYDRKPETLILINNLKHNEFALITPGNDSTGINLTNINCVIYIYPTSHLNNTVIQSLGRVKRVTSKYKNITLYNLHKTEADSILDKYYIDENEFVKYCKDHKLIILKHIRNKILLTNFISKLLLIKSVEELDNVPNIYYALYLRVSKKNFDHLYDSFSNILYINREKIKILINTNLESNNKNN
jgi:hypothetical protein